MSLGLNLLAVPPQPLIGDGTVRGEVTLGIAQAFKFKVRHNVFIKADGEPTIEAEVKRILNDGTIYLGPIDNRLNTRIDVSAYTVAKNAELFANEQPRPFHTGEERTIKRLHHSIPELTYEEEPTRAQRISIVDPYGDYVVINGRLQVQTQPIAPVIVSGLSISGVATDIDYIQPAAAEEVSKAQRAGTGTVNNITVVTSGVEQSLALPDKTKKFSMRCRGLDAKMRLAFNSGETNTGPYFTIEKGNSLCEDELFSQSMTLYFQVVDQNNRVVEILTWK